MLLEVSSNMPMRNGKSDCLLKKRISWETLASEILKSPLSSSGTRLVRRSRTVARTSTRFTSLTNVGCCWEPAGGVEGSWVCCGDGGVDCAKSDVGIASRVQPASNVNNGRFMMRKYRDLAAPASICGRFDEPPFQRYSDRSSIPEPSAIANLRRNSRRSAA